MTYLEAIRTCDTIEDPGVETEIKLQAIEKILSMATINAVKKDILVKVIRWFWKNCVEVKA